MIRGAFERTVRTVLDEFHVSKASIVETIGGISVRFSIAGIPHDHLISAMSLEAGEYSECLRGLIDHIERELPRVWAPVVLPKIVGKWRKWGRAA